MKIHTNFFLFFFLLLNSTFINAQDSSCSFINVDGFPLTGSNLQLKYAAELICEHINGSRTFETYRGNVAKINNIDDHLTFGDEVAYSKKKVTFGHLKEHCPNPLSKNLTEDYLKSNYVLFFTTNLPKSAPYSFYGLTTAPVHRQFKESKRVNILDKVTCKE